MVRSITNEFTVQECDEMVPAKAYKLSLDDVSLGVMLICCLCIYIPTLNKIDLLTYLLTHLLTNGQMKKNKRQKQLHLNKHAR
jgi:hypothetical protein